MSFDPWNFSLKIRKFIRTPTPKMEAHLGMCGFIPSHSHALSRTWNMTPELHSRFAPLQALVLVTSPRLRSQQGKIKTRGYSWHYNRHITIIARKDANFQNVPSMPLDWIIWWLCIFRVLMTSNKWK
jgi:hypothetical protein